MIRKYWYVHVMMVDLYVFVAASIFHFSKIMMKKDSTTKNATAAAATVTSITSSTEMSSEFVAAAAEFLMTFFSSSGNDDCRTHLRRHHCCCLLQRWRKFWFQSWRLSPIMFTESGYFGDGCNLFGLKQSDYVLVQCSS